MTRTAEQMKGRAGRLARLMPSGPSTAARTPFVLLVVLLLAGGLISLLLLNSALNEGSFRLSKLKRETTELTDEQQALQRDVDSYSEPDALERRARELGMVPGGSPAFLNPDGISRASRPALPFICSAVLVTGPPPSSSACRLPGGTRSSLLLADALGAAQPGGGGAPGAVQGTAAPSRTRPRALP
ncbi:FtsB family cell division protein [Streptomyces sp. wa22]|uniref:FtsB family cell division protein n=1 Tax=Streptomyces sp. wa22 TaxID=1828244 RepID=UPI0011C738EA|nr:septum formation initiator family protein [Streptomyces sp. wa22]TXS08494.1 cell division protein FtsL [Streptomyces sp. wa22]